MTSIFLSFRGKEWTFTPIFIIPMRGWKGREGVRAAVSFKGKLKIKGANTNVGILGILGILELARLPHLGILEVINNNIVKCKNAKNAKKSMSKGFIILCPSPIPTVESFFANNAKLFFGAC